MPVIVGSLYYAAVDELFAGRTGSDWAAGEPRTYLRRFLVQVKVKEMGPVAVCRAPGLPLPYAFYISSGPAGAEYDTAALAIRRRANQRDDDDWQFWIVEVDYSTQMPPGGMPDPGNQGSGGGAGSGGESSGAANNPEEEAADIEWDVETVSVPLQKDMNGRLYVNSATQPFTPAPMFPISRPVLVMTRNELTWGLATIRKWSMALNSQPFLGADIEEVKCEPPKAKLVHRGLLYYYRVSYRLVFAAVLPDGTLESWQPQLLDQGTMRLQNDPTKPQFRKPVPIMRGVNPISQPDLLDGLGQPVKPDPITGIRNPWYLQFTNHHSEDFTELLEFGM
jgi:hypothetical protein